LTELLLIGLAGIIVMGISAQWLAWRLKIPAILLLLVFGIIAGPVTGFINTDEILGETLFPMVSLSVAIILFEGGLSLKLSELKTTGRVLQRLITMGVIVSWLVGSAAAYYILGLDFTMAALLGAILVVTGPTVIIPMLRQIRPTDRTASILRWEGILIDPIGAVLAVLVYESMVLGIMSSVSDVALFGIGKTLLVGGGLGIAGAIVLVILMRAYWIPDFLQNPVVLMMVLGVFTISDVIVNESGLLAATVMGVVLANQSKVTIKHIVQFKEDLGVLLISGLFIILASRLELQSLVQLSFKGVAFLVVMIVVARPLTIFISTVFSDLSWKERAFLSLMAPRGIVAAAIASVFALRLIEHGHHQAEELIPITFLVIIGTVAFYGIGGPYFARRFGVAQPNPQGVLIIGAQPWAVRLAQVLKDAGFKTMLVDTNRNNIYAARLAGVPTYYGSGLTEATLTDLEMSGIGRLMAITQNNSVNSLAALHFKDTFGAAELYQLTPREEEDKQSRDKFSMSLHGRYLFGPEVTYGYLARRFALGALIKKTKLTEEFDYEAFLEHHGECTLPLFLVTEAGKLVVFTSEKSPVPKPGQTLIALVDAQEEGADKLLKPDTGGSKQPEQPRDPQQPNLPG
jgi:NhaP-type Na+/H+ or K+/H+ antiporter